MRGTLRPSPKLFIAVMLVAVLSSLCTYLYSLNRLAGVT